MADNNVLGVVFFAVAFALALRRIEAEHADVLLKGFSALAQLMFRLTGFAMWLAPLGVLGATASTVGGSGWEGLRPYLALLGTAYLALVLFAAVFSPR